MISLSELLDLISESGAFVFMLVVLHLMWTGRVILDRSSLRRYDRLHAVSEPVAKRKDISFDRMVDDMVEAELDLIDRQVDRMVNDLMSRELPRYPDPLVPERPTPKVTTIKR